jgi:hypothetical protein
MAGIRTECIRRKSGSEVTVDFMLHTSGGHFPVELTISAGDSMGDIEKIALQKLETVLAESLEAVRQNPAYPPPQRTS